MMKHKFNSNQIEVDKFLEEIKSNPLLENYDVNIFNVNDFALLLKEKMNCANCKTLEECQNDNLGFYTDYIDNNFVLCPCEYKKQQNKILQDSKLIKTLFMSNSILTCDLADMDLTTTNRKKIMEYVIKFINNLNNNQFCKGLYLYGGFATGKTFILGCIANELAKNKINSLIIYFPDLVVELKNALNTPRFDELVNHLKSVDVLFLDDLGSENITPWLRDEILGPILNYRLMEKRPVFISTNLEPNGELLNHLTIGKSNFDSMKGTRLKSRLEGLVIPIEVDNASYKR